MATKKVKQPTLGEIVKQEMRSEAEAVCKELAKNILRTSFIEIEKIDKSIERMRSRRFELAQLESQIYMAVDCGDINKIKAVEQYLFRLVPGSRQTVNINVVTNKISPQRGDVVDTLYGRKRLYGDSVKGLCYYVNGIKTPYNPDDFC